MGPNNILPHKNYHRQLLGWGLASIQGRLKYVF